MDTFECTTCHWSSCDVRLTMIHELHNRDHMVGFKRTDIMSRAVRKLHAVMGMGW